MTQSASNIITLITERFHSLNHLSSLGSLQPVPPNKLRSKLQPQEPSLPLQVPIYPWVERRNYSKVSCSRTQVSQPGFKPTLCWTETPELEFGALNRPAMIPIVCYLLWTLILTGKSQGVCRNIGVSEYRAVTEKLTGYFHFLTPGKLYKLIFYWKNNSNIKWNIDWISKWHWSSGHSRLTQIVTVFCFVLLMKDNGW